jgi:rubrerythrin
MKWKDSLSKWSSAIVKPDEYKKIISSAIDSEIEAYTFYKSVSERVKDKALKTLFLDIAGEETKHREFLQNFMAKEMKVMHFDTAKDYKVTDSLKTPKLSADMKPLEGLVIAIKKELEAMMMYNQLANASTDASQKKLFMDLVAMERSHKSRLEDIYTNMAFPEVW